MNAETLCAALQQAMPPLFVCSPAPEEGVRVRDPDAVPGRRRCRRVRPGAERRLHRH